MALPPRFGEWRRETVPDAVMLPRLFLAFRIPPFGTPEHDAASIAGAVLGLKKGSRLYRALVRERQVASEAGAFTFDLAKGNDLLVADATARPEISGDVLEMEVAREIDTLRETGVSQEEVERAITLAETQFVTSMQSAGERAAKLSLFATYLGDPTLINEEVERYRGVTRERVNAFIEAYLTEDNRASLLYVPREPVEHGVSTASMVEATS
jgi:predicted Zn-dependent peptidase